MTSPLSGTVPANSLDGLGNAYQSIGRYERAIDFHRQSLTIDRDIGNRRGEAVSLGNLGNAYQSIGRYERAIDFYQQQLDITIEIGDRQGTANSLIGLGLVYSSLGKYERAIDFYQQSLTIDRDIGDRRGEAASLGNLGNAYNHLEKYEQAIDFHQQSLTIDRDIGYRRGEANALGNLGLTYRDLGEYEQALDFHQQSLAIDREIGDRNGEARSLHNIGLAYTDQENYIEGVAYIQQALALFKAVKDRSGEGLALNNLGLYLFKLNQPQLAITFYKASVDVHEAIRGDIKGLDLALQQSYTNTIAGSYRALADLLLQQDRILEAQQVLDLLKVQELEDYLKNTRSSDTDELTLLKPEQEILNRHQELQTTAITIGQELSELRQRKNKPNFPPSDEARLQQLLQLEQEINQQFNTFIDSEPIQALLDQLSRKTLTQTVDLEDLNALRDNLRKTNAALIYPLILDDRLELILTTPDSPPIRRTVTNFDAAELKQTIIAYRSALQSPNDLEGTQALAQQLYTWLIAPLEADLAAANPDTLIYAPDGALRYIPLAALHDGKQWLAQRYATNNVVAKSLTEFNTAPANNPRVLAGAWGNQSHHIKAGGKTFNFGSIPFTLSEVQSLAQLLPTESLLEQDFSRNNLTAKDLNSFNIIHLATHGKFVVGDAANSFLALGSGEAIPLPEIKDLTMTDVDLVVLSACETGVGGNFGQGEEILGLGYQFQRAGAKASLASLWQVDDGGTQQLMNAFYSALNQGMTKAEALRQAQIALIGDADTPAGSQRGRLVAVSAGGTTPAIKGELTHPYYWAPFILIGNGL